MNYITETLISDLRWVLKNLGNDGGVMSTSIYDTAQILYYLPSLSNEQEIIRWLIEQQKNDGGWGDVFTPQARDVPTIASLVALQKYNHRQDVKQSVRAGLKFLGQYAAVWENGFADQLTVGVELLLPYLIEEAHKVGLEISSSPYKKLFSLRETRFKQLKHLSKLSIKQSTAIHSWESWGKYPDVSLLEHQAGVGHSPAATAKWLSEAMRLNVHPKQQAEASAYLSNASYATDTGITGLYPTLWPITRYEQSFSLYMLLTAGLLHHARLQDVVQPQIKALADAFSDQGIGLSDWFKTDGDDTAVVLAILHENSQPLSLEALKIFEHKDHYCAFAGELQSSLSVTAHAAHVLQMYGRLADLQQVINYTLERQRADGSWPGDKWNTSWIYVTSQVLIGMQHVLPKAAVSQGVDCLLRNQKADGGWGTYHSNGEETAYALLALKNLEMSGIIANQIEHSIKRGLDWLLNNYRPFRQTQTSIWIGKEAYCPSRIAKVVEISAILSCLTQDFEDKDVNMLERSSLVTY